MISYLRENYWSPLSVLQGLAGIGLNATVLILALSQKLASIFLVISIVGILMGLLAIRLSTK
jgi:hypothetical protein